MASRNSVKNYQPDSYYHIYNRGVEKRVIFIEEQDYGVFLSYLKQYLLSKDEESLRQKFSDPLTSYKEKDQIFKLLRLNNFNKEITLQTYCLMPNHFHLLLKQSSKNSIDQFMNSLGVRYVMYFNKKYKRVGPLFQDVYKAVPVFTDEQLIYLSSYIHRNPLNNGSHSKNISQQLFSQPSSYPEYLGKRKTAWIQTEEILANFSKINPKLSYRSFVEQAEELMIIQDSLIDFTI